MSDFYDVMTPAELRKEADRRELIEKARRIAEKRVALEAIADAILAIPAATVQTSGVRSLLKGVLIQLVELEDKGEHVTNGDVNIAFGFEHDQQWREATAGHPKVDYAEGTLARIRRNRNLPW